MRLLVVGDVHAADTAPGRRTETYRDDILRKLTECVELANKAKVPYLLFMGDIFHMKEPRKVSHRLVQDISKILEDYSVMNGEILILVGNHDITHGRLESLDKQPLGVLAQLPKVRLLTHDEYVLNEDVGGDLMPRVTLYPIPGIPGITVNDYAIDRNEENGTRWHAIVSHQSVVPDVKDEMEVLQNKYFIHDSYAVAKVADVDMVLYGHQHRNDGMYKRDGKIFANLGSICRLTVGKSDVEKKPSVLLLDFSETDIKRKIIELDNVRPSDEAYDLEEHVEAKAHRADIEDAIHRLNDTTLDTFSIETIMMDLEVRDDVEENPRMIALDLLESVK
jgi:DNA repair exonuclease SbcCD nuclease subunit